MSGRGAGDGRADHRPPQQATYVAPGESCRARRLAFAEQGHQQQAGEGQRGDQQMAPTKGWASALRDHSARLGASSAASTPPAST